MLRLSAWLPELVWSEIPTGRESPEKFMYLLCEIIQADAQGQDIEGLFQPLKQRYSGRRAQAFLCFLQGQLWLRRKRQGAWHYLDEGFRLADGLLGTKDYFDLMNRHALLRRLPLQAIPQPATTLASLLNEAAVIERLQAGQPPVHFNAHHHDTLLGQR